MALMVRAIVVWRPVGCQGRGRAPRVRCERVRVRPTEAGPVGVAW